MQSRNILSIANFINLPDSVLNIFYNKLARYKSSYDLIHKAKQDLKSYAENALYQENEYFGLGYDPHLPLPNRLYLKDTDQDDNEEYSPGNSKQDSVWQATNTEPVAT